MRIGVHTRSADQPLDEARELGVDLVQLFTTDPQKWNKPVVSDGLRAVADSEVDVVVHSSYVLNVASLNNRIRIPSRKALAQQVETAKEIGAIGVVLHGGHVRDSEDPEKGVENWRKLFERQAEEGGFAVPIWVENTAGGDRAMARRFDAIARLWDAIGEFGPGFCLDTCHAWAGGEELDGVLDRVRAITGRIDLIHLNNSRDEFDSARDRHANLESGTIKADELREIAENAGAPIILETPGEGVAADIAYLRG